MTVETNNNNADPGVTTPTDVNPAATAPSAASDGGAPPVVGGGTPTPGLSSPGVGDAPSTVTNALVSLGLNQDILGHERLKGINTVEDLANALVKADLAPPVVKPEEYQLPQGVPDDVRGIAHSLSLTQEQLNGVLQYQAQNFQAATQRDIQQLAEQGQQKLAEWGPQAQANLESGKRAVAYIESKSPGVVEMLEKTGYGNHPVVLEMFKNVGEMLKEGGFNRGEQFTPATNKTAADRMYPTQAKTE